MGIGTEDQFVVLPDRDTMFSRFVKITNDPIYVNYLFQDLYMLAGRRVSYIVLPNILKKRLGNFIKRQLDVGDEEKLSRACFLGMKFLVAFVEDYPVIAEKIEDLWACPGNHTL